MKKKKNNNNFPEKVMAEIKKKNIKMKPKIYFILASLMLAIGITATSLISIFLVNIISFRLRTQQYFQFLRFGRPGYRMFVMHFPWLLLFLAIAGIIGGILLFKKLDISYKKTFWMIVIGIIFFILVFGVLIDNFAIGPRMKQMPPPMKRIYQPANQKEKVVSGEIIDIEEDKLKILVGEEEIQAFLDNRFFNPERVNLEVGQTINAIGDWENESFVIKGILPARERRMTPPPYPASLRGKRAFN